MGEADQEVVQLGFLGDGDVSASQKNPVNMCNKEFADSDDRSAEGVVGRSTSSLGGGDSGERFQYEGCWMESP